MGSAYLVVDALLTSFPAREGTSPNYRLSDGTQSSAESSQNRLPGQGRLSFRTSVAFRHQVDSSILTASCKVDRAWETLI